MELEDILAWVGRLGKEEEREGGRAGGKKERGGVSGGGKG